MLWVVRPGPRELRSLKALGELEQKQQKHQGVGGP